MAPVQPGHLEPIRQANQLAGRGIVGRPARRVERNFPTGGAASPVAVAPPENRAICAPCAYSEIDCESMRASRRPARKRP
jgi:hypothetical protein